MENITFREINMRDIELYASMTVDKLIGIKDRHRSDLSLDEIEVINNACNLIYHNRKLLEKE